MSSSKLACTVRSTGVSSSCKYLRAMAMAFMAWLIAAGPVATTLGGLPPADSRTMLQMAPATEFGLESPLTLSTGFSEAATSRTSALARWSSPDAGPLDREYGVERAGRPPRCTAGALPPGALPPEAARRPPPGAFLVMRSSRDCGGGSSGVGSRRGRGERGAQNERATSARSVVKKGGKWSGIERSIAAPCQRCSLLRRKARRTRGICDTPVRKWAPMRERSERTHNFAGSGARDSDALLTLTLFVAIAISCALAVRSPAVRMGRRFIHDQYAHHLLILVHLARVAPQLA